MEFFFAHLLDPKFLWGIFSFITFLMGMIVLVRIHFSDTYRKFDLVKLIAIDDKGNLSDSKVRLNFAFIVTTWAFVYLTMSDHLTEWYVTVFLGAWVTDRIFARKDAHRTVMERTNTNIDIDQQELQDERSRRNVEGDAE